MLIKRFFALIFFSLILLTIIPNIIHKEDKKEIINIFTIQEIYTEVEEFAIVPEKVEVKPIKNRSSQASRQGKTLSKDIELLARIIQAEAIGECYQGKLAVGEVVLNRVKSDKFPNTIKEVLFQHNQFCGVNSGLFKQEIDSDSLKAAYEVYAGTNITGGGLFFLNKNKSKQTGWFDTLTFTIRIGDHWFYK